MNEDKIIADYIRDRFPQMLNTSDFAMYKFGRQVGNAINCFTEGFKSSFNSLKVEHNQSIIKEVQDEVDSEEDDQRTMDNTM